MRSLISCESGAGDHGAVVLPSRDSPPGDMPVMLDVAQPARPAVFFQYGDECRCDLTVRREAPDALGGEFVRRLKPRLI